MATSCGFESHRPHHNKINDLRQNQENGTQQFHVASLTKPYQAISMIYMGCRKLHATWMRHEILVCSPHAPVVSRFRHYLRHEQLAAVRQYPNPQGLLCLG